MIYDFHSILLSNILKEEKVHAKPRLLTLRRMALMRAAYVMNGHFPLEMVGSHQMVCSVLHGYLQILATGTTLYILIPLALVWCQFYSAAGCTGTASDWLDEIISLDNSWFTGTKSFTCADFV